MDTVTLFDRADVLAPMTESEARAWRVQVGSVGNQLRIVLNEGYERGAWVALGYSNWTACIQDIADEYGLGERYIWKLHTANQIEKLLPNRAVGDIPESQLRPLTGLPPETQRTVWQQAVETAPNGKVTAAHVQSTVTQFKREEQAQRHESERAQNAERVRSVARPEDLIGTFAAIMIDPPWDWGDEGDVNQFGRAKPRYATMPYEDILALPLAKLAAPNAHLYMWITNRSLPKGFALVDAWGFRYVTCITWVKPHFGLGNYYRGQTEHLLFGVRGSLPLARHDVGTVFHADRGPDGHSSKPDAAYEMIERCSPGPYLDMFSRRQRPEWVTWGENGIV